MGGYNIARILKNCANLSKVARNLNARKLREFGFVKLREYFVLLREYVNHINRHQSGLY